MMFDGITRLHDPSPSSPRPAPFDVITMLPAIRADVAGPGVEVLAVAVATNTIAVSQWFKLNWGCNADLEDHNHPWRAAALDPSSPPYKLAEARSALADAITRYRVRTGGDGLSYARSIIERMHGAEIANHALAPLDAIDTAWWDIEAMITDGAPGPEPALAQRQANDVATADWMLTDPALGDLGSCLRALLAAWRVEG
jgi:hypothetical protein